MIDVHCFPWGDDFKSIFAVNIAMTSKVLHLKDAIGARIDWKDVRDMELRSVNIPYDNNITDSILNLDLSAKAPLQPMESLSEVFHERPNPNSVHIVITSHKQPPAGELPIHVPFVTEH